MGPVLGTLFKKQHKILVIDFENEGIIEHLTLEGEDADLATEQLHDIRKAGNVKRKKIDTTCTTTKANQGFKNE